MCEALPLKKLKKSDFTFEKSKFGFTGTWEVYTIDVEWCEENEDWGWFVHRKITIGYEICSCEDNDQLLKTPAKTSEIAKRRAIQALNKWRKENL